MKTSAPSDLVTLRLPRAQWDTILETLTLDSESKYVEASLRAEIKAAVASVEYVQTPAPTKGRFLTRKTPGVKIYRDAAGELFDYTHPNFYASEYTWKLDVGAECNQLNDLANRISQWHNDKIPYLGATVADMSAIRSLVDRVANFEGLVTEPKKAK